MEENIKPVKSKKEKIKLAVLVVSILMIVGSMSYAFFVAATSTPAITDVDLTTETSEALIFTPGTPINLVANLTNFAENAGSLTESTTSTATLRAASSVGSATEDYYVYFNITTNDFVYTVDANTPEMILKIIGPDGEIKTIDGLNYKTVIDAKTGDSISGFDVTTHEGLIAVKELQQITTTNETIDSWTATITFINLNSDQTGNEGKTFDSVLILRQDPMVEAREFAAAVMEDNGGVAATSAMTESVLTSNTTGLYSVADDYGTSYIFRGEIDNNWVFFENYYWRIIRVNGDNSVRMIYAGETAPIESQKVVKLGEDNGFTISEATANKHSLNPPSIWVTTFLDNRDNDPLDELYQYMPHSITILHDTFDINQTYLADTAFCSNISAYSPEDDYATSKRPEENPARNYTVYYNTRVNYPNIDLQCDHENDAYTVNNTTFGNNKFSKPYGLITAEEALLAGIGSEYTDGIRDPFADYNNSTYKNVYLYTNETYLTISPAHNWDGESSSSSDYAINRNGRLQSEHDFNTYNTDELYMKVILRPVINVVGDMPTGGTGQWNDPYILAS